MTHQLPAAEPEANLASTSVHTAQPHDDDLVPPGSSSHERDGIVRRFDLDPAARDRNDHLDQLVTERLLASAEREEEGRPARPLRPNPGRGNEYEGGRA